MNKKEKMNELINFLNKASEAYYNGKDSGISDHEWDKKFDELKELEETTGIVLSNSPTQKPGATVVDSLEKVKHEYPALSLAKFKYKNRKELVNWMKTENADRDEFTHILMWKMDGLTVVLTYDNGNLTKAVTRGDGIIGSDITHNAKFFKGIPLKIACTDHVVVRGECVMYETEFERINLENDGIYENARNLASATIQMLDSNESRKREINFYAFELVSPEPEENKDLPLKEYDEVLSSKYMYERLQWLKYQGFQVVDFETVNCLTILDKIEEWKNKISSLEYPTDGLVISEDDLILGWKKGSTGRHPRWSMALKWTDETVKTTLRDIDWSVGATGAITPVAIFDTVRLGLGSDVSRASLSNLSVMENTPDEKGKYSAPKIGSKIEVYLANMIIPHIDSCDNSTGTKDIDIPKKCPVCGKETKIIISDSGTKVLKCINPNCAAKQIKKLDRFVSKHGFNIDGLSEAKIEDLINKKLIKDGADLLTLPSKDLSGLIKADGWGKKSVDNMINAIKKSLNIDPENFLYALSIPLCGRDVSKKLIESFDIEDAINLGIKDEYEKIAVINGLGPEKSKAFCDWFKDAKNLDLYNKLKDIVSINSKKNNESGNACTNLIFVVTGDVHHFKNRDELKSYIESQGGKCTGSVSKKTSYLINNDVTSTSGKNQKAKELGIPIISEDEFVKKFKNN